MHEVARSDHIAQSIYSVVHPLSKWTLVPLPLGLTFTQPQYATHVGDGFCNVMPILAFCVGKVVIYKYEDLRE